MKLQEYQLKNIFRQYGIPIPDGRVTSFAREAKRIAEEISCPVVVKAQVQAEGRGMSGGIRLARTPEETEEFASEILASHIKGLPVSKVLIDEAVPIEEEYYLLIAYDRSQQIPVLAMYDTGSVYIETAANSLYENLERVEIDPLIGLQQFQIYDLASRCNFPQKYQRRLFEICKQMWQIFCDLDALLVAINPLAFTPDGRMLALDGKITLDDNAFFRQQTLFDAQYMMIKVCLIGLLHSEICGSKCTYHSPQLIAVNHVLHRLPMPRHSPCALFSFTICFMFLSSRYELLIHKYL